MTILNHRGVWFGHQGVAGTDTWLEAASKKSSGDAQKNFLAGLGTIAHASFTEISANQQRAMIRSKNEGDDKAAAISEAFQNYALLIPISCG